MTFLTQCLSDSDRWKSFDYIAEKEKRDIANGKGFKRQLLTGLESRCGTIAKGYAKCRSTEPFLIHPENKELSRIFTPLEHCRLKGIPESLISGLSDTVAHQILGQSVIFPVFEDVAHAVGTSLVEWAGIKPVSASYVVSADPNPTSAEAYNFPLHAIGGGEMRAQAELLQ